MDAPRETVNCARALRKSMTAPELRLWIVLRGSAQEGLKFRRQHPFGPFILDFYCERARLAVEVDSDIHGMGDQPVRDARRDAWMARRGVLTLRISARDVMTNLDGVVQSILATAKPRL